MRKPDFWIVGAPKCGTTSMSDLLAQHPRIFMPRQKDSNPLGSDLHYTHNINHPPDLFRPQLDLFLSWYNAAGEDQVLGDCAVFYLYSRRAACEVAELNPRAKIIIMLRNPVDMIFSLHSHMLFDMNEDIEDFADALEAEPKRRHGRCIPSTACLPSLLQYRAVAAYAAQVERFLDVFGSQRVHFIVFDDFCRDMLAEYQRTLEFLGVESFMPQLRIANPMKQLRSRTFMRLLVDPPSPLRPLAGRLSRVRCLREMVRRGIWRYNVIEKRRPPMDPSLRRQLQVHFSRDIEQLGTLLNRDLGHWCAEDRAYPQTS